MDTYSSFKFNKQPRIIIPVFAVLYLALFFFSINQAEAAATITKSIGTAGRNFSTLQAWEDARDGNLLTRRVLNVTGGAGTFTANEVVNGTGGCSGAYIPENQSVTNGSVMTLDDYTGACGSGNTLTGATSGATATFNSISSSDGTIEKGEAYKDSAFTAPVTIVGSTTDSAHYMWLTAASGQRHNGTAGTGVVLRGFTGSGITVSDSYTIVEWFEITAWGNHANNNGINVNVAFISAIIRNNLIHDPNSGAAYVAIAVIRSGYIYNNIIYNMSATGIREIYGYSNDDIRVFNNTIYNYGTFTSNSPYNTAIHLGFAGANVQIKNNIVLAGPGTLAGNTDYSVGSATASNNISSDASAPGTNSLTNKTASNLALVSTTAGSENLHLQSASIAVNAGADLSSTFSSDIDSETRAGVWDIGADEVTGVSDTIPPVRSNGSPSGTLASGTTSATLSLATNENATCKYSTTSGTAYGSMTNTFSTTGGTSHSTAVSGLTDGNTYNYYVRCQDGWGNANTTDFTISFSVASPVPDTVPPSTPVGLTATAVSSSQINLSWTASTDNVGVTGYKVYRCTGSACTPTTQIATSTTTSYSDIGLTVSTVYTYAVSSYDAANNESAKSTGASATTQAIPSGGAHPKLFLTPTVLSELQAKAAANDADWLAVKARADMYLSFAVATYVRTGCSANTICYDYEGFGWLDAIQNLGIAYQVTGNVSYANKVKEIIDAANAPYKNFGSVEPESVDSGFPSRAAAFGLALAFDWVYDQLSPQQKIDTVNTLNAWFDWMKNNAFERDGPAYGNYFGGHLLGFGVAGYATYGDNPRAQEIIDYTRGRFDTYVSPAFATGGFAGGYPLESYNYGPNHFVRLFQYMSAVKTATGENLFASTDYAQKVARNLLYNLKPNRWQSTDEGDFPGSYTGVMPGNLPLILTDLLEGTIEGKWMQWYYNNFATPPPGANSIQTPGIVDRVLYRDVAQPSLDYRLTEPTYFRSPSDEHIYIRSSWQDGAVWASFAAGGSHWTDHESKKAGHIAIQRGNDYLLVNSGQWKGQTGISGTPNAFDLAGWRTNTLFFDDLGEYLYVGEAYVGGQGVWGKNIILAYEGNNNFVYAKSNFTDAYDKRDDIWSRNDALRSLRYFHRNFVYLEPNYVVVFDRIKALKDTYIKKLYWHSNPVNAPVITGNTARIDSGSSSLFIKTLLPSSPSIVVEDDPPTSGIGPRVTYRTVVSDPATSTDFNPLTVMAATANTATMPATSLITSSDGKMVGTLIAATTPRVVMFAQDGTAQSALTYTANYSGSLTGKHLLADIVPGAYNIYKNGIRILDNVSASTQGVLSFDSLGGSTFQVVQVSAELPPLPDTTPPVISSVAASSVTSSGATITWLTDELSDTQVEYGTAISYGSSTTLNTSLVTSHSQVLSGLSASTLYHYRVKSKDAAGNLATSVDFTFITAALPPVISNVQATNISTTSATITWTTDRATTSKVNYGLSSSYSNSTVRDTTLVTNHSVSIGGLSSSTLYHYQVESTDSSDLTSVSSDATFTTANPVLPVISNIQSTNITTTGATITWTTDISANSQVEYGLTTGYGSSTTLDSSLVTNHLVVITGLSSATAYNYRVKSSGSISTNRTFTTPGIADTTPPSQTSNLGVTSTTTTSVTLSWTAPGDDGTTGIASSYQMRWSISAVSDANWSSAIILTGLPPPQIAGTTQTYTAIGLSPNIRYYFAMKTLDESGNISPLSNVPNGKTKRNAPNNISNLTATASDKTVQLNWSAPSGADSDISYAIIRNTTNGLTIYNAAGSNTLVYSGANLFFNNANLTNGTTYYYSVFAYYDLGTYSGGVSVLALPQAASASTTTANAGGGSVGGSSDITPPQPVKLSRIAEADSQIILEWTNPTDEDFVRVLIVQNTARQPFSPDDGQVILEDKVQKFTIANLQNGKTYYFNIYTLDLAKNLSSPLKIKATPKKGVESFPEFAESLDVAKTIGYVAPELPTPSVEEFQAVYPSGVLIKGIFDNNVYLIENGTKRLAPNWKLLQRLASIQPRIIIAPHQSFIDSYPSGPPLTAADAAIKPPTILFKGRSVPRVFLVDEQNNLKRPISSLAAFYSLGFSFKYVQEVDDKQLEKYQTENPLEPQLLPDGFLMKSPDSPRVYIIHDGKKRWIITTGIFKTYGFDFKKVATLPKEFLEIYITGDNISSITEKLPSLTTPEQALPEPTAPITEPTVPITPPSAFYPNGTLIKGLGPTIYYIESGKKRAFTPGYVFEFLGYKQTNVKTVSDTDLNSLISGEPITSLNLHPNSTLVKLADKPEVYLIENNQLRWISIPEILIQKGFRFQDIIIISNQEFSGYKIDEPVR